MANDYFEHNTKLVPGTKARAEDVNARFDGVVAGMEKLPAPHPSLKGFSDPVAVGAPTEKEHAVSVEQALGGGIGFGTDTGVANAYVVALPVAPVSYRDGLAVTFKAINGNTGASTINLNGLGVKSLTRADGVPLVNGDIAVNQICSFLYDGTKFKATAAFAGQFSEVEALVQIHADAAAASATQTALDAVATAADLVATSADSTQTSLDAIATAVDRVQTGLDVISTGADATATAADRVQTGLDKTATAADRAQTSIDKTATAADAIATASDKIAAETAKTAAETAATSILGVEPAVIAQGDTQVARVLAEGDTQDARVLAEGNTQVARLALIPDPSTGLVGQVPTVNATLDGFVLLEPSGGVESITGTADEIDVDITDPANPVLTISAGYRPKLEPTATAILTGNMIGLDWSYLSASSITVNAGTCFAGDDNTTVITRSTTGAVNFVEANIASWVADGSAIVINKVYNHFVLEGGSVQFDTDVNGSHIVGKKRWNGFVTTDASGNLILFEFEKDKMYFSDMTKTVIASAIVPTTFTQYTFDAYCPPTRVGAGMLTPGVATDSPRIHISADGTNSIGTVGSAGVGIQWIQGTFLNGWYLKAESTTYDNANISLASIELKR
jgi:hypothetical protein